LTKITGAITFFWLIKQVASKVVAERFTESYRKLPHFMNTPLETKYNTNEQAILQGSCECTNIEADKHLTG